MIMWLWTDYCTVDNESLTILSICLKQSKMIEIFLSDKSKMRLIIVYVYPKFHKKRTNSKKKLWQHNHVCGLMDVCG